MPEHMHMTPVRKLSRSIRTRWHRLKNTRQMTIDGVKVITDRKRIPPFIQKLLFRKQYEDHERALVREHLRRGDRVLEIGCGIGLVSLVATRVCGEGNVFSYEANPRMEEIIRENYRLNGWEPDLTMKAVTADGRRLKFFQEANILSSSLIDRNLDGREIEIESVAINDAIRRHDPTVIVMDVEGAEEEILPVADLEGVRALILELHPHIIGEAKVSALVKDLEARGFSLRERIHKTYFLER